MYKDLEQHMRPLMFQSILFYKTVTQVNEVMNYSLKLKTKHKAKYRYTKHSWKQSLLQQSHVQQMPSYLSPVETESGNSW